MLKFEDFKKEIMKTIGSYMPENYKNLALKEVKIDKINQTVEGFCFADENKDMTASAVIYFKDIYSKYLSTGDIKAVLMEAAKAITYYDSKAGSTCTTTAILSADMVKTNTVMLLINAEMNRELLNQVPYVPFLDLAIVFRCITEKTNNHFYGAIITKALAEALNLSTEALYTYAKENTKRILPMRFEPLSQTMEGFIPKSIPEPKDSDKAILYILSNDVITEGASYIVYKEVLNEIRKDLNSDFFIIPSSINEVMILKTGINGKTYLKKVLKLINDIYIDQSDILSNNIYLYNGNLNIV